jgi:hypothetical protein
MKVFVVGVMANHRSLIGVDRGVELEPNALIAFN